MDPVQCLIDEFEPSLDYFERNQTGGFDSHLRTMALRATFPNVATALDNDRFIESLRVTLSDWKLRRAGLLEIVAFGQALREKQAEISDLETLSLGCEPQDGCERVWSLIESITITRGGSRLVSGTKALHHLLPQLVVPVDRMFTGSFIFAYQDSDFKAGDGERETFRVAFRCSSRIAAQIAPNVPTYRARHRSHTSITKLIDNAIFGFVGRTRAEAWGR